MKRFGERVPRGRRAHARAPSAPTAWEPRQEASDAAELDRLQRHIETPTRLGVQYS